MKWTKAFRKSAGKEMTVVSFFYKIMVSKLLLRRGRPMIYVFLHEISEIIIDYKTFALLRASASVMCDCVLVRASLSFSTHLVFYLTIHRTLLSSLKREETVP